MAKLSSYTIVDFPTKAQLNLFLKYVEQRNKRIINPSDDMKGSYLGIEFSQEEIEKELKSIGANFEIFKYEELIDKTSEFLTAEKAIGWFQGRMEFGPRALGNYGKLI